MSFFLSKSNITAHKNIIFTRPGDNQTDLNILQVELKASEIPAHKTIPFPFIPLQPEITEPVTQVTGLGRWNRSDGLFQIYIPKVHSRREFRAREREVAGQRQARRDEEHHLHTRSRPGSAMASNLGQIQTALPWAMASAVSAAQMSVFAFTVKCSVTRYHVFTPFSSYFRHFRSFTAGW